MKHGRLTLYAGDYDYFLRPSEENDRAAITAEGLDPWQPRTHGSDYPSL